MANNQNRTEIIRQLEAVLDEIANDPDATNLIAAKASIAKGLVRKLAPRRKGDGDVN